MEKLSVYTLILIFLLLGPVYLWAKTTQEPKSDKPVLIREPEKPEGEAPKPPPEEFSPAQAEKNVEVGNYYFKRKRYNAAISRYLEAIRYKPNYVDAYKLLAKAYEKNHDLANAIGAYEKYLALYPTSNFAEEFKQEIKRLKGEKQEARSKK
jgi:tetratricopeptide (TPR) repeat protein